ncbi:hypothetical protein HYH03_017999 [Edaphochlamys debaryana]|uniref:Transcription initiation factor TFIID subunit 13 n=1 Tax=Edaphochlamys debaryana TaxID=47281 RepID=A0A835XG49_9CHLO|nr:hypothetical protein HYH03_017999 [Edaphochlamys debaryana]|eukprot:KAG2483106.1 hypothetical protein HYH03_017999 [Edaphochlamys debaryana]
MDPAAAAAATPPSTGKAKPRARKPKTDKAAAGDASPGGDKAVGAGAGPATPGPAAAGGSGAGGKAAAEGLSPAGGVTKKRARPAKPKAPVEAAAAGEDFGGEEPPQPVLQDTSMPYRGTFTKDLCTLMYGFGDSKMPHAETVNVVEDILVEFVRETCCAALNEAARHGKLERGAAGHKLKLDEKDLLFLVRKDPKKYTRIRELLEMQLAIKEARKMVDVDQLQKVVEAGGAEEAGGEEGGGEEALGEELPDNAAVEDLE